VSQAARSAGIDVAASHLPLANCQKSSCGRALGSIAETSMPERGSAIATPAQPAPIAKARMNFCNIAAG
jgi:hypothetical protein